MASPDCVITHVERVREGRRGVGPPIWLVVCRCGWSNRVIGSEDRAKQSHNAHRHDFPDMASPGPIQRALVNLGKLGISYETIEDRISEEDSPAVE